MSTRKQLHVKLSESLSYRKDKYARVNVATMDAYLPTVLLVCPTDKPLDSKLASVKIVTIKNAAVCTVYNTTPFSNNILFVYSLSTSNAAQLASIAVLQ